MDFLYSKLRENYKLHNVNMPETFNETSVYFHSVIRATLD